MAAKLKLVELHREITQKQLEDVEWLRENIRLLIDQYEFDLAMDEKRLREALKRGAEVERGS